MSGEAKFHLGFKISSFYHLQGATAAGKRNESSLLHKAAPSWHLFPSKFHLCHVRKKRETHWGRAGAASASKARGQQSSVTRVPSVPTVGWQRGEANTSAECGGLELGNLPEAISSQQ